MTRRALAELVRGAHDQHGGRYSYRQMSDRAHAAGYSMSHSHFADLAAGRVVKAPSEQQQRAIAAGTGVSFERVQEAVFEQYHGYVAQREDAAGMTTIVAPADLTAEERAELDRMIAAWLISKGHEIPPEQGQ